MVGGNWVKENSKIIVTYLTSFLMGVGIAIITVKVISAQTSEQQIPLPQIAEQQTAAQYYAYALHGKTIIWLCDPVSGMSDDQVNQCLRPYNIHPNKSPLERRQSLRYLFRQKDYYRGFDDIFNAMEQNDLEIYDEQTGQRKQSI